VSDADNSVHFLLGQLDGKVSSMLTRLEQLQQTHDAAMQPLTKRVQRLEENRAWVLGAAAAIGLLAGLLPQLVPFLR
jgi:ElaB/YqjD/DUF883 family membrane-anchored ribosome-binding protein